MVDISRLSMYIPKIINNKITLDFKLVLFATLAAFLGVYYGNKLLKKTTLKTLQNIVALLLLAYGFLLIGGII